jgi:hypothetical protein
MKRIIVLIVGALVLALGVVAAVAADPGHGNGPPATVPGSPGGDCSHGNSDQDCRPDPQPEHGQDCEDHGVAQGNEDHCAPVDTTPTDTTPTDTTPTDTTPTETTPTETTPTEPTPTTPEVTTSTETAPTDPESTPGPAAAPESAPSAPGSVASQTPQKTVKPKAKKKAATKIVKVTPKPDGIVIVTTADGKRHTAVMGSG